MDGFHLADVSLQRLGRAERKGAPDTFDAAGYVALLQRLRTAMPQDPPVWAPMFERDLEQPLAGAIEVPAEVPLVITEGNYLLSDLGAFAQVQAMLDACWFVEAPESLRHERLIARHQQFRQAAAGGPGVGAGAGRGQCSPGRRHPVPGRCGGQPAVTVRTKREERSRRPAIFCSWW